MGIQLVVTLCLNPPYPHLKDILSFIRAQHGFIRLCVLSMERSPKELLDSLGKKVETRFYSPHSSHVGYSERFTEKKLESGQTLSHIESIDIYELLEHIQRSTHNSIAISGIVSLSELTCRLLSSKFGSCTGTLLKSHGIWILFHPTVSILWVRIWRIVTHTKDLSHVS